MFDACLVCLFETLWATILFCCPSSMKQHTQLPSRFEDVDIIYYTLLYENRNLGAWCTHSR
jgi:hypothetical protein